jgi:nitroimidazol reductase NimA-like FMN-containing flavoprotein (pyridoxamine 5'-phosphate oxidase superfamily)
MRELGVEECWARLERSTVGRVGFTSGRDQVILPVNYRVAGHSIVVRTGSSELLDNVAPGATVAFEVDEVDATRETGWSVLLKGHASEVTDPAVQALRLRPWASGYRSHWLRIVPWAVTGMEIGPF